MAKLKRKSAMVVAPKDADEANVFLDRIGDACRRRLLIETALDEAVATLRTGAEQEASPLALEVEQLTAGLQLWAEANRPALTRNGATKTIKLTAGEIGWRLLPASVRITGVDAVIERLQALSLDKFLRRKVEVDKDAMLREPAAAGQVAGVKIASEGENFFIAPASVALAEAAGS